MQQGHKPHLDKKKLSLGCAVITVSDTRTKEDDYSGAYLVENLKKAAHQVVYYEIIADEASQIGAVLEQVLQVTGNLDVLIFNGGTGIAPRDTTYDALSVKLEKTLPGFGELFRYLSYQEIGSRAIASRAVAGTYKGKLIFSLPGSTQAVKLAMEKLIEPELVHLIIQLKGDNL
jgi:molybdenum cofactor biosynthesis protein B